MATLDGADGTEESPNTVRRALDAIRSSALWFIAALGVLILSLGVLVELGIRFGTFGPNGRTIWGIWAAIFTWWGIGLLAAGVTGRAIVWYRRRSS